MEQARRQAHHLLHDGADGSVLATMAWRGTRTVQAFCPVQRKVQRARVRLFTASTRRNPLSRPKLADVPVRLGVGEPALGAFTARVPLDHPLGVDSRRVLLAVIVRL